MKSCFMNKSLSFLKKYNNYTDEEIEKLQYGLEGIYLTLTKLIIILLLSLILNIFKEVIILYSYSISLDILGLVYTQVKVVIV